MTLNKEFIPVLAKINKKLYKISRAEEEYKEIPGYKYLGLGKYYSFNGILMSEIVIKGCSENYREHFHFYSKN